jgi:hypothetical protein
MANKKIWLGILVMVLVFGMTVVSCDNGSTGNSTDPTFNGTWIDESAGTELKFNNGNFEFPEFMKGTYTASDGKMTTQVTHYLGSEFGGLLGIDDSEWYTKSQLKQAYKTEFGGTMTETEIDKELNDWFASVTGTYKVDGNKLIIIMVGITQTYTYTKK